MADLVTDDCGSPMVSMDPNEIVQLYAKSLMSYYEHPEMIREKGLGAIERVKSQYSWDAIGRQFDEVYELVVQSK